MRIALALIVPLALCAPAGAQEIGRLFHTPEQRQTLDAWRRTKPQQAAAEREAAVPPAQPARVDGYVLRSDGKSTVWVNGDRVAEGAAGEGLRTTVRRGAPGRVTISTGAGERRHEMKVGETLHPGSGDTRDLIGEGEIKVRR